MAGFKTHITTSTLLGIGYGGVAFSYGVPLPACVLGAGLCGVSGMLPDLDSDSGVPLRESLAFAAAVVPMLLLDRFQHLGFAPETMVLAGALVYLLVRFGVGWFLRSYTVHRGMFHSLPAALIFGEIAYLLCMCDDELLRLFKSGGVVIGYLSHLLLDELYSLHWKRGRLRLKKSFGTALKLWGDSVWANISTYAKLGLVSYLVMQDQHLIDQFDSQRHGQLFQAEQASDIESEASSIADHEPTEDWSQHAAGVDLREDSLRRR
jgi:hypothetical protein